MRPLGMQGQQLLSQRQILQNEVCSGPKHSRQPAEQVSKRTSMAAILSVRRKMTKVQVVQIVGGHNFGE